jgi:hypothetical protein
MDEEVVSGDFVVFISTGNGLDDAFVPENLFCTCKAVLAPAQPTHAVAVSRLDTCIPFPLGFHAVEDIERHRINADALEAIEGGEAQSNNVVVDLRDEEMGLVRFMFHRADGLVLKQSSFFEIVLMAANCPAGGEEFFGRFTFEEFVGEEHRPRIRGYFLDLGNDCFF